MTTKKKLPASPSPVPEAVPGPTPTREVTPFQQRVYDATRAIPRGKVATYAVVARAIGCGAPRAVGQALRNNPFAPVVPCHRVVGTDRTLTGFNGATEGSEMARKRRLLESEGVKIEPDGTVARSCIVEKITITKDSR